MKRFQYVAVAGLCAMASQASAMNVLSISAEVLSDTSSRISVEADEDTAFLEIYQNGVRVATTESGNSVTITSLQPSTDYQYFATACSADGICSVPSGQATIRTSGSSALPADVCEAATDGSAPEVALSLNGNGTAELIWCEVTGAEGYNIFRNGLYDGTVGRATLSTTVSYDGSEQYQVAYYFDGNFPPKSAVADVVELDDGPVTDLDILAGLDAASQSADVEIYFTRHAEKMTLLAEQEDGSLLEVCGEDKCAEVLNAKGELRAELLKDLFQDAGITDRLTHAFSSHKIRTRQTIEMITADAGLTGDIDKNPDDGIQEFPITNPEGTADATELDPESTSPSEAPVIEALLALPSGSVALVAGHSGTIYDIMAGIGLTDVCLEETVETCSEARYPIDDSVKVANFGDIWKVVLQDGVAEFVFRANFQPSELDLEELAQ